MFEDLAFSSMWRKNEEIKELKEEIKAKDERIALLELRLKPKESC